MLNIFKKKMKNAVFRFTLHVPYFFFHGSTFILTFSALFFVTRRVFSYCTAFVKILCIFTISSCFSQCLLRRTVRLFWNDSCAFRFFATRPVKVISSETGSGVADCTNDCAVAQLVTALLRGCPAAWVATRLPSWNACSRKYVLHPAPGWAQYIFRPRSNPPPQLRGGRS